jgi:hypothetical protein
MRATTIGFAAGLLAMAACPPKADADDVLLTLRKEHPRLYLLDRDLAALKTRVESNPTAKAWYAKVKRDGEVILTQSSVAHGLKEPRKPFQSMIDQSLRAFDRVSTLALLYRLDGDRRWLDRARKEMLAVASFPDWNPNNFLDTAILSHALAIGYDWLHKDLSETDRKTVREALVGKGIKPGLKEYREKGWWTEATFNWNQICNCGMAVAALAVADDDPAVAREVVDAARLSIVRAMKSFASDGGWAEGPFYWNHATRHNCQFLDAVSSALGTDFDLKAMPGFSTTDRFWAHVCGPSGLLFNFADSYDAAAGAAQMLWLAREFRHPWAAASEANVAKRQVDAFHLIWSDALDSAKPDPKLPTDALFRGVEVAFFRSAWDDPKAVYVGFKGGDNQASHAHLDLGSFVLDADGQRWAVDLGGDSYGLPGYFGDKRWEYFRTNTQSHNTLTIDGKNQDPKAKATIVAFHSSKLRSFAVADLTKAYATQATAARRGIALRDHRWVLVQDELTPTAPSEVLWKMLTRATVAIDGSTATLKQNDVELTVRVIEPSGAKFETQSASAPAPQNPNRGVTALVVRVAAQAKPTRIVVLIEPGSRPTASPKVEPLDQWVADGKLPAER